MKSRVLSFAMLLFVFIAGCTDNRTAAQGQSANQGKHVGGQCEGCEAIYETPIPFEKLSPVDTFPDFNEKGPKLVVSGIVYKSDGKTPAPGVVLYAYHTDQKGIYPTKGDEKGWAKRHGYLRGWVKTDKEGRYTFYTLRPGAYPSRRDPAHIHITVKEPDKNEYYIDEYLFADDPLLANHSASDRPRGGNGVVKLTEDKGMFSATRHIILGLNIPDYPVAAKKNLQSGLSLGANLPAFDPIHISGADKGTKACPMCKYGYGQGVLVWFNHTNLDILKDFTVRLEKEMKEKGEKKIRVFMVYMNPAYAGNNAEGEKILRGKLEKWCREQGIEKVAMVWVPSPVDEKTSRLYAINPDAKNTVFVYKNRKVVAKWTDIDYNDTDTKNILNLL